MKSKKVFGATPNTARRRLALPISMGQGAAVLCAFMFAGGAMAQEVLAPPPPDFSEKAPAYWRAGTNQLDTLTPAGTAAASANQGLLQWGPIHLRPHLLYRFLYGNGIQAQPGQQSKTVIHEVAPGMLVDLGSHWHLDYTPTLRFYSSSRFRDSVDHSVNLNGGTLYRDWTFGLSQSYSLSSTPLVETASQTDQESYSTAVNAAYQMSSKMSLELGVNQNFRFLGENLQARQLSDSSEWSTMDWLNYQFWPKFGVAIGAGFGYNDVSVGSDMTYEQVQGRINWRAGEKLSFLLNGGFEDRQFLHSAAPDSISPTFGLTLRYRLFEATTISLNANRGVSVSYFQSQITESTGFNGSIRQRLFQKLHLALSGGYSTTSFKATTTGLAVNREDDRRFVNLRLSCPLLKRGTASVFYDASENSSSESGFKYSSSQIGLEIGYRF